jgi:hypothetical protein
MQVSEIAKALGIESIMVPVGKAQAELPFNVAALTPEVFVHCFRHGVKQLANDGHSDITEEKVPDADQRKAQSLAIAQKKLDQLASGKLRAERVAKPKDTAGQIAIELAMDVLRGGHGAKVTKLDRAKVAGWCKEYVERNPKVMEEAKLIAARRAELAAGADESGIDLDALMPDADETPDATQAA